MNFFLEKIILWPSNEKNKIEEIIFHIDKVNIIHGRSGTGKSSIISIIDYCLGATRCSIPVGLIREEVEWFGVQANINNNTILIARRTPRNKQVSNEFFVKSLNEDSQLPERIFSNFNDIKIKNLFNDRILKISNLPQTTEEELKGFEGRASYRDLAAFNFLPQHIVANPNTLFYKSDSNKHKERLKKILPLALGIVDNEYLTKERLRAIKQRSLEELIQKQKSKQRDINAWNSDINNLWYKAVELGLIVDVNIDILERKIEIFKNIVDSSRGNNFYDLVNKPNYLYTNNLYKELKDREIAIQNKVNKIRNKIRKLESLHKKASDYSSAINLENSRVVNLEWLKKNLSKESHCVACGSTSNQLNFLIKNLDIEVKKLQDLSGVLYKNPIADLEIEKLQSELITYQNELHEVRKKCLALNVNENINEDSLSQIYRVIGRIEALLINYQENQNEDDLSDQITALNADINEIDKFFMNSGRYALELEVYKKISDLIKIYADEFNLEQRGMISLDKSELTLRFDNENLKSKEYLWEVGSGENWMGYHISTFLALHEYFSEQRNSLIFNFLVIDQPSQVYFPTTVSGHNELDSISNEIDIEGSNRNHDIKATKRIFEILEMGLSRSNIGYQIIVLEHADQSIWGGLKNIVEVRNWKQIGDGLIPRHWIRSKV